MLLNKNWNSLIKPSKLRYEDFSDQGSSQHGKDHHHDRVGKVIAEPLERGFGITLGNALRRILLSSLQGAAITSIKIPGIVHEFSAIPGVKEDLCEILLNIKTLALKMYEFNKETLRLKVTGPCVVTAGMFETSNKIEILDPDYVICTLAEGAVLEMEAICETGKGYIAVSSTKEEDLPIGMIQVDALFSPVKKVSYQIENSRVGQFTNYDKLIMHIETNGTITPEKAIALAARILQDQLQLFITFKEEVEESISTLEELPFNPVLLSKVDELDLSVRAQNCLKADNITYIGDLVKKTESQMLVTPNFGRKSLNELKEILGALNLKFGMEIKEWPPEKIDALAKKYDDQTY